MKIAHKFVKNIPDTVEPNTLYVSVEYATAIHKCFCGCGNEVVTPLSPTDWRLTFDGASVSLYPSVGNWSLPCQSHYWIRNSVVEWAPKWSHERIERGRTEDRKEKDFFYGTRKKKRWSLFDLFRD